MVEALIRDLNYSSVSSDTLNGWDSFDSPEPCSTVAQPIRQEEGLQKAQSSEEYKKPYKDVRL